MDGGLVVGKDLDEGWDYWMKVGMVGIKFYQIITWLFFSGGNDFLGTKNHLSAKFVAESEEGDLNPTTW